MTQAFILGAASALWLGILTSISPCPLTTNIAAVSFVGRRVGNPAMVLISGMLYTAGRSLAYAAIGALAVSGMLSIPGVSFFLQKNMHFVIGPILLVTGVVLTGIIPINISISIDAARLQKKSEKWGLLGSAMIGILFALAFCPVSAALFFGSLIPLSIQHGSRIVLPTLYGIGTGLPVIVFSVLIAFGAGAVGKMFNAIAKYEIWARRLTGIVFIVMGIYQITVSLVSSN